MDYVKIIKNSSKLYKKIKSFTEKNDDIYYYYDSEKNTITDTNKINKKEKPRPFEVFISDKAEDIIYDIYIPLSKTLKERLLKGVKEIVSEKMTINIKKLFKSNKNKVLEDDLDFEIKDIEKQVKKHYSGLAYDFNKFVSNYVSDLNKSLKLV